MYVDKIVEVYENSSHLVCVGRNAAVARQTSLNRPVYSFIVTLSWHDQIALEKELSLSYTVYATSSFLIV